MKIFKLKKKKNSSFPLKTQGSLRLFFIGAGSAFSKIQCQTNLLIIKGEDHLLLDCGTKCPQALWEINLPITAIRNFLITHSHADHIGGLEECALMGRYFAKTKPNLIITEEYQKILWEMSLKGGIAFGELINGRCLEFEDLFCILRPRPIAEFSRQAWEIDCNSLNLIMLRTKHIPDSAFSWQDSFFSVAVIIDRRVLFTSDTRFDPVLITETDKKYNFEAIFHDCQFFPGGVHASLEELDTLPLAVKKKIYLIHYGDNYKKFFPLIKKGGFAGLALAHYFYEF